MIVLITDLKGTLLLEIKAYRQYKQQYLITVRYF